MDSITILIPNWNGRSLLERLLGEIPAQGPWAGQVIVVDNGSTDGSQESAARGGANVLRLPVNLGFAAAVNQGLAEVKTEWVAILNNDVTLRAGWLETLYNAAVREDAWFATGKVLSAKDPGLVDGSFDLLSRGACALRAGHAEPDAPRWNRSRRIQFPPFTAVLVRRELFERVGPLEERFGSYLEDVEFGLRCALSGFDGIYEPLAVALHEGSATLGAGSAAMVRMISRNQLLLVALHWPRGWFGRYGRAVMAGQVFWGISAFLKGRGPAWTKGKWEGWREFADVRGNPTPEQSRRLDEVLRRSEAEIRELQEGSRRDRFWSWYFSLA
jgi:GT2 family glycosyltransferase